MLTAEQYLKAAVVCLFIGVVVCEIVDTIEEFLLDRLREKRKQLLLDQQVERRKRLLQYDEEQNEETQQ